MTYREKAEYVERLSVGGTAEKALGDLGRQTERGRKGRGKKRKTH